MQSYDVIVVGGGAAGLACAVTLSQNKNLKVLVIDAGERAGKKLSQTGNGQGNVTNADMQISHFRSGNLPLVKKIACKEGAFKHAASVIFGAEIFKEGSFGRVYPQSMQASSLTDILLYRLKSFGGEILLSSRVENITHKNGVFCVDCGKKFFSEYVVLATGGKAQKQFKTDGSSYALAQNFGHKITPLYPSIVQLKTDTTYIKGLKGIRAFCLATAESNGASFSGDIIFTDYGVSGNAAFYLSGAFSGGGGTLNINFLPDVPDKTVIEVISNRQREGVPASGLLCGVLHNKIAEAVIKRAKSQRAEDIAYTARNFTLTVTGTLGFDCAQVTKGGVDMHDIDEFLQSKLCPNLYFAGEILDVDGDCGGYNLHWAFTGGVFVAERILELKKV